MDPSGTDVVELVAVVGWIAAVAINVVRLRRLGIEPITQDVRGALRCAVLGAKAWFGLVLLHALDVAEPLFAPRLWQTAATDVAGSALALGSVALYARSLADMDRDWRIGIDARPSQRLVTRGVYRWSRNPIYLALDMLAAGVALTSGAPLLVVIAGVVVLALHLQVRREERHLAARHGDDWVRFARDVPRYLGRSRRRARRRS